MNPNRPECFVATYNGLMRHIDISDPKSPFLLREIKPSVGLCYAFHWHPTERLLAMVGAKSYIELLDVDRIEESPMPLSKKHGHDSNAVPWVYWVDGGKRLLSTDSNETILWSCPDPRNVETWTIIFKLKDKFFPLQSHDRTL